MKRLVTTVETNPELTPLHRRGIKMNTVESKECGTESAAMLLFAKAEQRLLDVNGWNKLAAAKTKQYTLTDSNGQAKNGLAKEGDHICFDLPAPDSDVGEGQDWVQIERLVKREGANFQSVAFKVRTSSNPLVRGKEIAHFYQHETTNTFAVERHGKVVLVAVYGRNEVPNTQQAKGFYNKVRNAMIGIGGWLGLSKAQWKILVKAVMGTTSFSS